MKKILYGTLTLLIFFFSACTLAQGNFSTKQITLSTKSIQKIEGQNYVPGEIIVKFKPTKINLKSMGATSTMNTFGANRGLATKDKITNDNIAVFTMDKNQNFQQKLAEIQSDPSVEYAQPNFIYQLLSTWFNDTYSGSLRGLSKIQRYEAYDVFSGNILTTGTIVAVLDAGVAYDHPDLVGNMRNGSTCKDNTWTTIIWWCLHGYDFADNDTNPYPVASYHGTHVAGTIAATANNNKWIIGINPNAQIMAIRAGNSELTTAALIKGIDFARYNGAKIINASFGGPGFDNAMYDAINNFRGVGWLFIAAAGNAGINHDTTTHMYPCDYTLDNVVCVAATDSSDAKATFSDFGSTSVDIAAPGVSINSTIATINSLGLYSENFTSTSTGTIPTWWLSWWTNYTRWVLDEGGHVLYGDKNQKPYGYVPESYITKNIDTSNASGINISFRATCDTQYTTTAWKDYMSLAVSIDDNNYELIDMRDEAYLDTDSNEGNNVGGYASANLSYDLPIIYSHTWFSLWFWWTTDVSDNNYSWCSIDNIVVTKYSSPSTATEPYGNLQWTSMATPHVAGLASLAWSYRSDLNYLDIKDAIINGWDAVASLSGIIVSGKRINAYTTLYNLTTTITWSISFLSGNKINTTWAYVRLLASKTWTYQMSWVGMTGILTWNIFLTWLDILVQLTSWDETKNISVVFFDSILKPSQVYTASILLDTTPPSIPILLSPISWTSISWVNLLWNTSLDTWWMSWYTYEISSDSGMVTMITSWTIYTTGVSIHLFSWGTYYRRVKAFDILGQYSSFSQTWTFILLRDSRPDSFVFTPVNTAELNTEYISNAILIRWVNIGSVVSILGGTYQLNATGTFITTTWIVYSGDTVKIKTVSSSVNSTSVTATIDIGGTTGNFIVTTKAASGWWGWWGGWGWWGTISTPACTTSQIICTWWTYKLISWADCTSTKIGLTCTLSWITLTGTQTWADLSWLTALNSDKVWSINGSHFSTELNAAYLYAYSIGITTLPTVQQADLTGTLIRKHLAKMISSFAITQMWKVPNTGMQCNFIDMNNETVEMKFYSKLACQLGLMGLDANGSPTNTFNPNSEVSRAQFGTVLSRTLRGNQYNGGTPYYILHLNELQKDTIMQKIDTPENKELRGYVMLMLMRSVE